MQGSDHDDNLLYHSKCTTVCESVPQ